MKKILERLIAASADLPVVINNLLDMLVQVPLVLGLQLAVRTVIDNILMFGLNMFLDVANLGILVVTKVTLEFSHIRRY